METEWSRAADPGETAHPPVPVSTSFSFFSSWISCWEVWLFVVFFFTFLTFSKTFFSLYLQPIISTPDSFESTTKCLKCVAAFKKIQQRHLWPQHSLAFVTVAILKISLQGQCNMTNAWQCIFQFFTHYKFRKKAEKRNLRIKLDLVTNTNITHF